jgi:hypothetical protein
MRGSEVLEEIRRRGIRLEADGDSIQYDAPKGAFTPELRELGRIHREEVISALLHEKNADAGGAREAGVATCGSPACGGCYEVSKGVHLHPPKVSEEWKAWLTKWQPDVRDKLQ